MKEKSFSTSIVVDQTPEKAFNAINNVRGWWSEEVEGSTDVLNAIFDYHYEDVHRCKLKVVELIPNKRVTWLVLENYFNFTEDSTEWTGTTIDFEILNKGNKTEIVFTHMGLTKADECYNICKDGWTTYIKSSLFNLITKGKGSPNASGKPQNEHEEKFSKSKKEKHFQLGMFLDASPEKVFDCISDVTAWWTDNVEGSFRKLNDEFTVQFGDIHFSKQKLIEVIPNKKIVWLVTESKLNFIRDQSEWNGTQIVFELEQIGKKTKVTFTHVGLKPNVECYDACSTAWSDYILKSLNKLITKGKGEPTLKESMINL